MNNKNKEKSNVTGDKTTIRMPANLREEMLAYCDKKEISVSEFIRNAVYSALNEEPKVLLPVKSIDELSEKIDELNQKIENSNKRLDALNLMIEISELNAKKVT